MAQTKTSPPVLTTANGIPLKDSLRRAERRRKLKAAGLVLPLFLFLMITFITPILLLLYRAIENPELLEVMPRTVASIQHWDGADIPDEAVFTALAADLRLAHKDRTVGKAGKRLNYDISGFRSLVLKTARRVARIKTDPSSYRDTVIAIDKRWGNLRYWSAVKQAAISRLSPVMNAAATTVFGVVPLLSDGFWVGLAVTIMFGLGFATLLTLTTAPQELVWGLGWLFSPLKRLGLPVEEFFLSVMLALGFFPLLAEELDTIISEKRVRGKLAAVELLIGRMLGRAGSSRQSAPLSVIS